MLQQSYFRSAFILSVFCLPKSRFHPWPHRPKLIQGLFNYSEVVCFPTLAFTMLRNSPKLSTAAADTKALRFAKEENVILLLLNSMPLFTSWQLSWFIQTLKIRLDNLQLPPQNQIPKDQMCRSWKYFTVYYSFIQGDDRKLNLLFTPCHKPYFHVTYSISYCILWWYGVSTLLYYDIIFFAKFRSVNTF